MCDDILVVNFKDFKSQEALTAVFGERWLYIGRENKNGGLKTSPLGNPFKAAAYGGRGATLPYYKMWLWQQMQRGNPDVMRALQAIRDNSVLVCWCKPEPCHGDVVRKAALWLKAHRPKTAFISGHLDLNKNEFAQHYQPLLDKAIALNHHFVVGDAPGADAFAQMYLLKRVVPERVTVYHKGEQARNLFGGFQVQNIYPSQTAKDTAMTAVSGYDIAWVRPGKESSGTARNLARRDAWLV